MTENKKDDANAVDIRNDGGLITGAALVGGTKLVYDAGKDLYAWLKPEKKIFIQIVDSIYSEKHHLIRARVASAHVHGVHIESIQLKEKNPAHINVYQIYAGDNVGYGNRQVDSEDRILGFPHLIAPSGWLDIYLKVPEQTDARVVKENGVNLICKFAPIDRLGDVETVPFTVRLRWA
ncbi:MAG: hypothetical protein Q7W55_05705 [Pseudohongiella sp.]|nr:hypothetical protein [Pseudohongiella sp.]